MRNGRIAGINGTSWDIGPDAGSGSNDGPISDFDMVGDSNTSTEHYAVANGYAAGKPYLSAEQTILTDLDIVPDQDVIIDLGAGTNSGGLQCAAVNRRERTHFHVVADFDDR